MFKLFFNKFNLKKIVLILTISFSAIITGGCSLANQSEGSVSYDPEDIIPGKPFLVMKILDYPESISDSCQEVIFTIEVENVGDTSLFYDDFAGTYSLDIVTDDGESTFGPSSEGTVVNTTVDYAEHGISDYNSMLSDFGELKPGDKKTITYKSIDYVIYGDHEYLPTNGFENIENGNYNYYVSFGEVVSKIGISNQISTSQSVEIATDLQDEGSGITYCESGTVIDESLNLSE